MAGDDFSPSDISKSVTLKEAVTVVQQHRNRSTRAATKKLADTSHLFGEIRQPATEYVAIPRHVSETRKYWTAQINPPSVICGDANMLVSDPDGLQFGFISSSMFISGQRTVGGRIKSDYRFSSTLTWNTFPVPELDEATQKRIIKAGQKVLDARALHPDRSLAEHYNPLAIAPELVKAHDALDREVDKAMGAPRKLTSERQRLEILFANYARLIRG